MASWAACGEGSLCSNSDIGAVTYKSTLVKIYVVHGRSLTLSGLVFFFFYLLNMILVRFNLEAVEYV